MKRTEKSRKRSRFLFILIILTAILSITATYAWFSVQRDVEIGQFEVNVQVADNMRISLDGENWTQTIEIKDMRQLYGIVTGDGIYQASSTGNVNYIPTELKPVSSDGTVQVAGKLSFVQGVVDGKTLSSITACSETDITTSAEITTREANNDSHPYLAFDLYIQNMTATDDATQLQLNKGSVVTAENTTAGIETSVRVGFVAYNNTVSLTAEGADTRAIAGSTSDTVAIWEPNYDIHSRYAIGQDSRLPATNTPVGISDLITRAVTYSAVGHTISNIETDTAYTTAVSVNRATAHNRTTAALDADIDGYSVPVNGTTEKLNLVQVDGSTVFSIAGNKISKVRVYLWIEGQDPDNVSMASAGKKVIATIRLTREATTQNNTTTYSSPTTISGT